MSTLLYPKIYSLWLKLLLSQRQFFCFCTDSTNDMLTENHSLVKPFLCRTEIHWMTNYDFVLLKIKFLNVRFTISKYANFTPNTTPSLIRILHPEIFYTYDKICKKYLSQYNLGNSPGNHLYRFHAIKGPLTIFLYFIP